MVCNLLLLKARCRVWRSIIWRGWWRPIVSVYMIIAGYSVLRTEAFPQATLPPFVDFIPKWHWTIWAIIGLAILLLALLEGAYRILFPIIYDNWIERHRIQYGKYPPLPKYLQPLVNNYSEGEPISKDIEPITPSGQTWQTLLHSQKKQWEETVRWLGKDPQDLIDHMKMMLPKTPDIILKRKRQGENEDT